MFANSVDPKEMAHSKIKDHNENIEGYKCTVGPPQTVTSKQQPPSYNSQFSLIQKCSFTNNCNGKLRSGCCPVVLSVNMLCLSRVLVLHDVSHEISSLISCEKQRKSIYECHLLQSWLALSCVTSWRTNTLERHSICTDKTTGQQPDLGFC